MASEIFVILLIYSSCYSYRSNDSISSNDRDDIGTWHNPGAGLLNLGLDIVNHVKSTQEEIWNGFFFSCCGVDEHRCVATLSKEYKFIQAPYPNIKIISFESQRHHKWTNSSLLSQNNHGNAFSRGEPQGFYLGLCASPPLFSLYTPPTDSCFCRNCIGALHPHKRTTHKQQVSQQPTLSASPF